MDRESRRSAFSGGWSFLLFSERTGWKHLYRVAADGSELTQLTTGEWEVRELLSIDESERTAIVTGTRKSKIARAYQISLSGEKSEVVADYRERTPCCSRRVSWKAPFIAHVKRCSSPRQLKSSRGDRIRILQKPITVPTETYRFGKVELRSSNGGSFRRHGNFSYAVHKFDANDLSVVTKTYAGADSGVKDIWNARLPEHLLANLDVVVIIF